MSLRPIIEIINDSLKNSFKDIPGAAFYGVSELIARKNSDGTATGVPGIISITGEIKYVGFDDKNPLIIYHRAATVSIQERPGSSYGDIRTDQVSTYTNAMFVYADRKSLCMDTTELFEFIQAAFPENAKLQPYKNIVIRIISANFNTQSILRSEYQDTSLKLRPERVLVQINYQIETTFRKQCVARCA